MATNQDDSTNIAAGFVQAALPDGTELAGGKVRLLSVLQRDSASISYHAQGSDGAALVVQEFFPSVLSTRDGLRVAPVSDLATDATKRLLRKFTAAAQTLTRLQHPALPTVVTQFAENDTAYVAWADLSAETGAERLGKVMAGQRSRLRLREITRIMDTCLKALAVLHEAGLVHGNLSPDSILVTAENQPVLTHFNLLLPDTAAADQMAVTQPDDPFVAPEFMAGTGLGGVRSDLYSLAATFYLAIFRIAPPSALARVTAQLEGRVDPLQPLRKVAIAYRPAFRQGLDRALCISEADRPASARDWLDLIAADGPYEPRPGEEFDEFDAAEPVSEAEAERLQATLLAAYGQQMPQAKPLAAPLPMEEKMDIDFAAAAPLGSERNQSQLPKIGRIAGVGAGVVVAASAAFFLLWPEPAPDPVELAVATVPEIVAEPAPVQTPEPVTASEPVPTPEPVVIAITREPVIEPVVEPASAPPVIELVDQTPEPAPTVPDATVSDIALGDTTDTPMEIPMASEPELADPIDQAVATVIAEPPAEPPVEPVPFALQPDITDVSALMSAWSVELPFSAAADAEDTIDTIVDGAEPWVRQGRQIVAVNGIDVARISDISPVLRQTVGLADAASVEVVFEVVDLVSGDVDMVTTTLPVVRDIALLNGLRFQERLVAGARVTVVTMAPPGDDGPGSLQTGDLVTSYLPTNEKIGIDINLADLMTREMARGTGRFEFSVQRDGGPANTSFLYAPGGN